MGGPEFTAPQFATLEEMDSWFDANFCDIRRLLVVAPTPDRDGFKQEPEFSMERLNKVAGALSPARFTKSEWMRKEGNEAWYGPRIAIVHRVWNELKARHDAVVNDLNDQRRKLEQVLSEQERRLVDLRHEAAALSEKKEELSRKLDVTRRTLTPIVLGWKKVGILQWARDAVKSIRELLATELK